jgi:carbon storage regulator
MESTPFHYGRACIFKAGNMLILARKIDESIMIGDQIEVSVVDIKGDQVKIGIAAPQNIKVYRKEVYLAIQKENIEAVKAKPDIIPALSDLLKGSAKKSDDEKKE